MAKDTIYFVGSLSSCESFPTFPVPFANLPSLYIPISNLKGFLFPLVHTLQWSPNSTLVPQQSDNLLQNNSTHYQKPLL